MRVVFAPGCVLRKKGQPAIAAVMEQLRRIYGDVELYERCCRNKLQIEGESRVLSVCSGCVNKYARDYAQLTSQKLWDAIAEHPEVPFANESEVREMVRAAYRRPKKPKRE